MSKEDRYWICDAGRFRVYMTTNDLHEAKIFQKEACETQQRYHFIYDTHANMYLGHYTPDVSMPPEQKYNYSLDIS